MCQAPVHSQYFLSTSQYFLGYIDNHLPCRVLELPNCRVLNYTCYRLRRIVRDSYEGRTRNWEEIEKLKETEKRVPLRPSSKYLQEL